MAFRKPRRPIKRPEKRRDVLKKRAERYESEAQRLEKEFPRNVVAQHAEIIEEAVQTHAHRDWEKISESIEYMREFVYRYALLNDELEKVLKSRGRAGLPFLKHPFKLLGKSKAYVEKIDRAIRKLRLKRLQDHN